MLSLTNFNKLLDVDINMKKMSIFSRNYYEDSIYDDIWCARKRSKTMFQIRDFKLW